MRTIRAISGTDWAPSHLDTDWRLTSSISASSSWDQPFFFLRSMILSARIMVFLSFCFAFFAGPWALRLRQIYPLLPLHARKTAWNFRNRRLQPGVFPVSYHIIAIFRPRSIEKTLRHRADRGRFSVCRQTENRPLSEVIVPCLSIPCLRLKKPPPDRAAVCDRVFTARSC